MENSQWFDSPFEEWPGRIQVPIVLDAAQFVEWWEISRENEKDEDRPSELKIFEERFHLILGCEIEGLNWANLNRDGSNLPSMAIAMLVVAATQGPLSDARILPNLQTPLKHT